MPFDLSYMVVSASSSTMNQCLVGLVNTMAKLSGRLKPQTTTLCTTAVAAWSQQPKNGERKQRKKACKNEGKLSVVFTYFLNKVF